MDKRYERLKQVLAAAATAPGNRDRFLKAGLIDTTHQLATNWQQALQNVFPIEKQIIRACPGLFLANVDDIVYRGATSGSRGQSFIYFAGTQWNTARIQARRHSLAWWGIGDDTPMINVASRLLPVRDIDVAIAGQVNSDFIQLLLSLLCQCPAVLRGYPSRLCEVATQLYGDKIPAVKAIICTGENLFDYQRSLLKTVFKAPIIEEYGCQETGISGLTCPEAGRLHLDSDRCFYEIIDGQLVTTDLFNLAMPMVRYKSGDLIELSTQPCLCGRPGITGKVLGRIEDGIRTVDGMKRPGEITMPAFEGILNYQVVRRQGQEIDLGLQPAQTDELSLAPLATWLQNTFGDVEAQIFLNETEPSYPTPQFITDADWIDTISSGSWSKWLQQSLLPKGEAKKAAQLLQHLVNPAVLINSGLSPTTQTLLQDILDSPPCQDPKVEWITARVLLFSCCFLANDPQVTSIYHQAALRLQHAIARLGNSKETAVIDQFIPSLFLDINTAKSIWTHCPVPNQCYLDTFTIQHLLYAFEPGWRKAISPEAKPTVRILRPILAILMGDLGVFASRFGAWLLAHWCELIHGQAVVEDNRVEAPQKDKFLTAWLTWRRQMLRNGENLHLGLKKHISALQETAQSPEEVAQVKLENAYGLLVAEQTLNPDEWLNHIDVQASLISQGLTSDQVDPVPWIPILRSLSKPLLDRQDYELAYQCLVASAVPSSRTSAFERLALQVNDKQSVICDLFNGNDYST